MNLRRDKVKVFLSVYLLSYLLSFQEDISCYLLSDLCWTF